jgi:hypothetical protein
MGETHDARLGLRLRRGLGSQCGVWDERGNYPMGDDEMSEYKTSDLQLAAYLTTLGHAVIRVEGPRDRKLFVFQAVSDADVAAFYGGAGVARARDLFRSYRDLRNLVYRVA